MSYYGILNKPTDNLLDSIDSAMNESLEKLNPQVEKFIDSVRDKLWSDVENYLISDNIENIRLTISRECQSIIEAFLVGDLTVLKATMILSDYTHSRLTEVRKAIFNACGDEITKQVIKDLEDKNKRLKEDLDFYKNRNIY